MQIKFAEENKEVVDMVQSVDLNKIFSIITFGAKDKETKQALDRAIQLVTIYSENHKNHESNDRIDHAYCYTARKDLWKDIHYVDLKILKTVLLMNSRL